jgi:hypothetical protein
MNDFVVFYSGACFESGDSPEQVEKKLQNKIAPFGKAFGVEATILHPNERDTGEENYAVSFEGEIAVQADTREKSENQGYNLLSQLGQITVVAFKKEEE